MKLSLFSLVVVLLVSCQNLGTKDRSRLDTFPVAKYWMIAPNGKKLGPFVDTAIYQIKVSFVFKDTTAGTGGYWKEDTSRYGRVSDDTLRDGLKRPLLDSSKHVQFHFIYYPVGDSLMTPVTHLKH